jgi:hypothetical protein
VTEVVAVGLSEDEIRVVSDVASDLGYAFNRLIPVELSTGKGQKLQVLGRIDAAGLYERVHRDRLAILYGSRVVVRRVPSAQLREAAVISLADFVRYKAFVRSVRGADGKWLDAFAQWCNAVGWTTDSDPRCLPFQTFSAKGRYDLDGEDERGRFEMDHHRPSGRSDDRGLFWQTARPNARHGREPIVIAGHELSLGYHWDVQGSGKISNSAVEYAFRGYINVYPDAGIRKGDHTKMIQSRGASQTQDEEERVGAFRRQGRRPPSTRPRQRR